MSVEGELGHVGGMDLERTAAASRCSPSPTRWPTSSAETGVDALAVSIGTAHGMYSRCPR